MFVKQGQWDYKWVQIGRGRNKSNRIVPVSIKKHIECLVSILLQRGDIKEPDEIFDVLEATLKKDKLFVDTRYVYDILEYQGLDTEIFQKHLPYLVLQGEECPMCCRYFDK